MKRPFNLSLDDELIEKIKIQAVRERTAVSKILEKLIEEYLAKKTKEAETK